MQHGLAILREFAVFMSCFDMFFLMAETNKTNDSIG
jgi:hypothetical protein